MLRLKKGHSRQKEVVPRNISEIKYSLYVGKQLNTSRKAFPGVSLKKLHVYVMKNLNLLKSNDILIIKEEILL